MNRIPIHELFGFPIMAATLDEVVDLCHQAIVDERQFNIGVVNVAKVVNARNDTTLRDAVRSCDIVVADGQPIVWAGRLLGRPLPERIAGIDLFERLLAGAEAMGHRVYLLGARAEVLADTVAEIRRRHPAIVLAGQHHGYFSEDEESSLAEQIQAARPHLLFVGMSSPRKETFLDRWSSVLGANVYHGVGGSFDVMAGRTKRAPRALQSLGLEWLFRLAQEPRRLWKRYLVTNTIFVGMVLRQLFRR